MRSLFLKIFLWFWATVIITGIVFVLTFILEPQSVPSQWRGMLEDTARYSGIVAVGEMSRGGVPAASAYIHRVGHDAGVDACLYNARGNALAGSNCRAFAGMVSRVAKSGTTAFGMGLGIAHVALAITATDGHRYIFATELPAGPRAAIGSTQRSALLQWGIAFLVSGVICYLLTRYLTTPIFRLRRASQELARGNLSTRAAHGMERRHDEIGDLVRDFNAMAAQIEELVLRQRQLISDMSHEIRSPLARLNVALDLAQARKGADPAFDHMERDLAVLNEITERLLSMARLETSVSPAMQMVNLTELADEVAHNAEFESQTIGGRVALNAPKQFLVKGNPYLLRSAIENVVRNAIRYTRSGTAVEMNLEDADGDEMVRLTVCDSGPGVPEPELAHIFRPFYRVNQERDRASGGAGLGLAIADRVIRVHGGSIRAENASPAGLRVEILLPRGFGPQITA